MNMKVYACYLKDQKMLNESSSGGAFTALSDEIFRQNGVVIACNYNYKKHELFFEKATNQGKRNLMRGSKYIQANTSSLYSLLEKELKSKENSPLLIVGTPCQIAGVKSWLFERDYRPRRTIFFCDLICHGVSSPVMWKKYIMDVEKTGNYKIDLVTFKDKEKGWLRPTAKIKLQDGEEVLIEDFACLYRCNDFMREACYECKFANLNRETDITIGDFWNIGNIDSEFANMQGTSLVLIHTEKGNALFQNAKRDLEYQESTWEACLQPNLQYPTKRTKRYKDIHNDYKKHGIGYVIEKYLHYGPGNVWMRKLRRKIFWIKYGK